MARIVYNTCVATYESESTSTPLPRLSCSPPLSFSSMSRSDEDESLVMLRTPSLKQQQCQQHEEPDYFVTELPNSYHTAVLGVCRTLGLDLVGSTASGDEENSAASVVQCVEEEEAANGILKELFKAPLSAPLYCSPSAQADS